MNNKEKLINLLQTRNDKQQELFLKSKMVRNKIDKNNVYIRGIIDISNYCKCMCKFCGNSAKSNIQRYIMQKEEIISSARKAKELNIDIIHLASGENNLINLKTLKETLKELIDLDLNIELAMGKLDMKTLEEIYKIGVKRFIFKFETSDVKLYAEVKKCNRNLNQTIEHIKTMKQIGFSVGSGNIIGLPNQTIDSIAEDLILLEKLDIDMCSTSIFTPNQESEFFDKPKGDVNIALNYIALSRLIFHNKKISIPSNSTLGEQGKIEALKYASNVLSLNLTPEKYKGKYSIYSGKDRHKQSYEEINEIIKTANLKLCSFKEWMENNE